MMLDQWFNADALAGLRRAVLAEAVAVGMPSDRANDVVLAVHELAANAVRHGGGTGRVQVQVADGALHCQVSDAGRTTTDGTARMTAVVALRPWLLQDGHGLWLVRSLADQLAIAPSASGSQVTAVFALPKGALCAPSASDSGGGGPRCREEQRGVAPVADDRGTRPDAIVTAGRQGSMPSASRTTGSASVPRARQSSPGSKIFSAPLMDVKSPVTAGGSLPSARPLAADSRMCRMRVMARSVEPSCSWLRS